MYHNTGIYQQTYLHRKQSHLTELACSYISGVPMTALFAGLTCEILPIIRFCLKVCVPKFSGYLHAFV